MRRFWLALAVLLPLALPPAANAQQPAACQGRINGEDTRLHGSSGDAINVDPDEPIRLELLVLGEVERVEVEVKYGPVPRTLHPAADLVPRPGTSWSGSTNANSVANLGVGLYEVKLSAGEDCQLSAWVDLEGNPLLTVAGATAAGVLVAGLGLQILGLVRGLRGRGGFKWALFGGIPTGLGACVLAQQLGVAPITPRWVAGWTMPPVAIGGVLQVGIRSLRLGAPSPPSAPYSTGAEDAVPGAVAEEIQDPPRSSYALLDCPDVVVAAVPFEFVVGLTPEPHPGVTGGPLLRPPASVGDWVLTVHVVADGFELKPSESWRHALAVTADAPYPTIRMHLRAQPQDLAVRARAIQVAYSVNGHTMGLAIRPVAVVRSPELVPATARPTMSEGVEIRVPADEPAADLTVRIQKADSQSGGKLMWTFDTPHAGLDLPDEPVITDIGDEPENFVRQLITGISVQEGRPGLHAYLTGVGLTIADEMPGEFWALLKATAAIVAAESRRPSVFLLSEEPYVPWELAVVPEPLAADPDASQFLGAQACVGRWVLGQRRPKLPPPSEVEIEGMAVISGIYEQPGWNRLLDAEAEAAELCALYGGLPVDAHPIAVLRCLAGDPDADILHFSLHGVYDPGSTTDGLVLVDGSALDPFQVKGGTLKSSPFVFLNACQVGAGSRLLGDYAGMAEAFLYAGASGVVAPLWSITDTLARGVAQRFYAGAFAGTSPAEVLRQERAAFREGTPSATALAYLYYGHPSLLLKREEVVLPRDDGPG